MGGGEFKPTPPFLGSCHKRQAILAPIKGAPITSLFGFHPILHILRLHAGIDFGGCGRLARSRRVDGKVEIAGPVPIAITSASSMLGSRPPFAPLRNSGATPSGAEVKQATLSRSPQTRPFDRALRVLPTEAAFRCPTSARRFKQRRRR